jgi:hypothetical protein
MLQPTARRPLCLVIKHPSRAYYQIPITVRYLRVCWCGTQSLMRGRVCRLQLLLVLGSAFILGSEYRGNHDHILLPQIQDFPFRRFYLTRLGLSVGQSWNKAPIWGSRPDFYYCQTAAVLLTWGILWQEDGSVFYNCCWPSPEQSFLSPSPVGLVTILYCLRFVASYDSQGYGGGNRPRLHTGFLILFCFVLLI